MKQYIISMWTVLDPLYYTFTRLTYVSDELISENIFRVRLTKYKGRDLILSDGVQIKKNDLMVKIHLHNVRLLKELYQIESDIKRVKKIYKLVEKSLPGVQTYIYNHERSGEIKGIVGITTLCTGSERLGFEISSISHPLYKWFKWMTFLPISFLSSSSFSLKKMLKKSPPGYLLMSKDKLNKLYKTYD
ncbi:hypothetical protein AM500_16810 [Bacillus sp. FJAT-18017]|uniref:YkoP family protein n=1 Tax=Bacillus sp. FJAT-18017 TaxID=1705566 RepID=UPI0006AF14C3|nr:hypothetical protein [Bacillus sp. FJAT-18017]ALC91266.1 hypothetical protein AM500_16810 [Bacillus sp. FJAT-18017]